MPNYPTCSEPLTVVGLGEALFDCFSPQRVMLGGAPVNLANRVGAYVAS